MFPESLNLLVSLATLLAMQLVCVALVSRYVQGRTPGQQGASQAEARGRGRRQRRHLAYAAAAFVLVAVYGSLVPLNVEPVPLRQFAHLPLLFGAVH